MGGAIGAEAARETIEMAAIVFGCSEAALAEKMPMISILCTLTPLAYDDRMLGAIMEYAKAGMSPVDLVPFHCRGHFAGDHGRHPGGSKRARCWPASC